MECLRPLEREIQNVLVASMRTQFNTNAHSVSVTRARSSYWLADDTNDVALENAGFLLWVDLERQIHSEWIWQP